MTEYSLSAIAGAMGELELEYAFLTYRKAPIVYPYFVGEYTETESFSEDGLQESTMILTGFARGAAAEDALETAKKKIRNYFTQAGKAFRFGDGSIAVVMYGSALPVPKEDADLKSIQINLSVKEWSVT